MGINSCIQPAAHGQKVTGCQKFTKFKTSAFCNDFEVGLEINRGNTTGSWSFVFITQMSFLKSCPYICGIRPCRLYWTFFRPQAGYMERTGNEGEFQSYSTRVLDWNSGVSTYTYQVLHCTSIVSPRQCDSPLCVHGQSMGCTQSPCKLNKAIAKFRETAGQMEWGAKWRWRNTGRHMDQEIQITPDIGQYSR